MHYQPIYIKWGINSQQTVVQSPEASGLLGMDPLGRCELESDHHGEITGEDSRHVYLYVSIPCTIRTCTYIVPCGTCSYTCVAVCKNSAQFTYHWHQLQFHGMTDCPQTERGDEKHRDGWYSLIAHTSITTPPLRDAYARIRMRRKVRTVNDKRGDK